MRKDGAEVDGHVEHLPEAPDLGLVVADLQGTERANDGLDATRAQRDEEKGSRRGQGAHVVGKEGAERNAGQPQDVNHREYNDRRVGAGVRVGAQAAEQRRRVARAGEERHE